MKLKILVVDDEIELCDLLAFQLEDEGYDVSKAYSYTEALEKFEQKRPDVILSDMKMPGGSGIDLFKELRSTFPQDPYQFYLISGFMSENEKELVDLGIQAILKKPMHFEDLLNCLPAQ